MNELLRNHAPISTEAWKEIDAEASRTLKTLLAARRLVDFKGPLGWNCSSVSTGRTHTLSPSLQDGVVSKLRLSLPLIEIRIPFEVDREELDAIGRGDTNPDLDSVRNAARAAAIAEDRAIFQGYSAAHIEGIFPAAGDHGLTIPEDFDAYPDVVAEATHRLRSEGVSGPYGIALGPRCYTGLTRSTLRGYPIINHVRELVDGPIVWAPAVDGAVVMSLRGGDFELIVGQDFSVGYLDHTSTSVLLYLQQSFTFRVLSPEAAVPLTHAAVDVTPAK
ncbi:bacteriocin [Steroidobacter agaridevorans]|uniref:Bacteriocin n=1 Tax=Steroidobacter agaridevorans TaxID=2695856 RepID=A0A829Y576_9GAMM|nr:family 1 encapsulin nanocompartment shell protein [Steroidobacter agaridevorans]GFE78243.1 bacteriocin [Steroidobacter agaridevorans]GFE91300.1 bacteriocin [Steroidobacter agaridevorans]